MLVKNNYQSRIGSQAQLLSIVVPIFLEYPLLTCKLYHFDLFHKALMHNTTDKTQSAQEKRGPVNWPTFLLRTLSLIYGVRLI